jgi:hypothetical protein
MALATESTYVYWLRHYLHTESLSVKSPLETVLAGKIRPSSPTAFIPESKQ